LINPCLKMCVHFSSRSSSPSFVSASSFPCRLPEAHHRGGLLRTWHVRRAGTRPPKGLGQEPEARFALGAGDLGREAAAPLPVPAPGSASPAAPSEVRHGLSTSSRPRPGRVRRVRRARIGFPSPRDGARLRGPALRGASGYFFSSLRGPRGQSTRGGRNSVRNGLKRCIKKNKEPWRAPP